MFSKINRQFFNTRILLITSLLALLISLPTFYLLYQLDFNKKYYSKKIKTTGVSDKTLMAFKDLDNDGISESYYYGMETTRDNAFVTVIANSKALDQWNFRGELNVNYNIHFAGDYDHNGFTELYFFNQTGDSIFLQGIEPLNNKNWFIKDFFITKISERNGHHDFIVTQGKFFDVNKDDKDEVFFAITAGYSQQPRRIYRMDIANQKLIFTESMGPTFSNIQLSDLDNDKQPELLINTGAYCNVPEGFAPYSDYSSWLMLMDTGLNFLFAPIEFPLEFSRIRIPVDIKGQNKQILVHLFGESIDSLMIFKTDGTSIKSIRSLYNKNAENISPVIFNFKTQNGTVIFYLTNDNNLYKLNANLVFERIAKLGIFVEYPTIIDIDGDGEDEILFIRSDLNGIVVYRNDFSHPAFFPVELPSYNSYIAEVITSAQNKRTLAIQAKQMVTYFEYIQNPLYYFRFIPYILVFIGVFLLLLLFQYNTQKRLLKKMTAERKMLDLQIKNVLNQLDPHFTFNMLNFIGSSIMKEEPKVAYENLLRFSRILRVGLRDAELLARPLSEEIEMTKDYLSILRHRFENQFELEIRVAPDVDQNMLVPKMVIHTYVENAVKHGIIPLKREGKVSVMITKETDFIKIQIEDNGVGMQQHAESSLRSTHKGIKLMSELYEYLNKSNQNKIRFALTGIFDKEGKAGGTKVEVVVPLGFRFEVS